jgi:hypothetical protein
MVNQMVELDQPVILKSSHPAIFTTSLRIGQQTAHI